ncbi:hypothetical protein BJH93_07855 [Kocuria polaris]|nr:hypothetical protein [Kocuria polaris]
MDHTAARQEQPSGAAPEERGTPPARGVRDAATDRHNGDHWLVSLVDYASSLYDGASAAHGRPVWRGQSAWRGSASPGSIAMRRAAAAMEPQALLQFAEDLRRFAEACGHSAIALLDDRAEREVPPHLKELKTVSDGMERSVVTGNMSDRAAKQVVAQHLAQVRETSLQGAAHDVERARVLRDDVPDVLAALADGSIGASQARTMVDLSRKIEVETVPAPADDSLEAAEAFERQTARAEIDARHKRQKLCASLLERSPGKTPRQTKLYGERKLQELLEDPFAVRHARDRKDRHVRITQAENGMCYLSAYLPSLAGEAIDRRLHELALMHKNHELDQAVSDRFRLETEDESSTGTPCAAEAAAPDERTVAQVRTDAFLDLLLAGPHGSGLENVRPQVSITVPASAFPGLEDLGPAPEPADASRSGSGTTAVHTDFHPVGDGLAGHRLPAGAALPESETFGAFSHDELAAVLPQSSSWTRLVTDSWDGAVVALDTDQYRPTAAMRRALALRDRTCRVPGCGRRASACEPDHVLEHQNGGRTELSNLISICKRCHRLKSWGLLGIHLAPDGTVQVTTWWDSARRTDPEAPWGISTRLTGCDASWEGLAKPTHPAEVALVDRLEVELELQLRRCRGYYAADPPPSFKSRFARASRGSKDRWREAGRAASEPAPSDLSESPAGDLVEAPDEGRAACDADVRRAWREHLETHGIRSTAPSTEHADATLRVPELPNTCRDSWGDLAR